MIVPIHTPGIFANTGKIKKNLPFWATPYRNYIRAVNPDTGFAQGGPAAIGWRASSSMSGTSPYQFPPGTVPASVWRQPDACPTRQGLYPAIVVTGQIAPEVDPPRGARHPGRRKKSRRL